MGSENRDKEMRAKQSFFDKTFFSKKVLAILIAAILMISTFPLPMAATADEPDANFTEAVNISGEERDTAENITPENQTNSVANATDDTTVMNETLLDNTPDAYNKNKNAENLTDDATNLTDNIANATLLNKTVSENVSTVSAATIYTVHPTDPRANFTSIQAAVNAASAGNSIEVWNSTYYEHVTVNKQLNIYSRDGADVTIVDGGGSGKCFYVTANYVNISGFTVQNGDYGIYLSNSDHNKITGNTVNFNNNYGIYLGDYCDYNEIRDNTVNSNKRGGIYMGYYNNNNKLIGNTVKSNKEDGIYLYYSDGNEITNNTIELNDKYGIRLDYGCEDNNLTQNKINYNGDYGLYIYSPKNYIAQSNVVNGERIYHFYKARGTPTEPIIVENLILTGIKVINLAKITLSDSRYVIVRNNTLKNSEKGVYISDSSMYNMILNNSISLTDGGIYLYTSSNNEITGNKANIDKGYGVYLDSGSKDNNLEYNILNSFYDYGLKVDNIRNYISQTNIANGERIYHFYKVYGTEDKPIIVENLILTGTKVSNMGKITIVDSRYITARNNILKNGGNGIWVDSSQFIKMINNSVSYNGNGIYLYSSNYNEMIDNKASDNDYGINLYNSDHNTIAGNTVSFNNNYGISLSESCEYNEIRENTVNSNKKSGIYGYWYSNNNKLIGNTVKSNKEDGIQLYYSDGNEITNNTVELNDRYGIRLDYGCEDNNLTQNRINYNGDYGLYISTSKNLIYNNYINNTKNAYDSGTNRWNITKTAGASIIGGPYLGGNYWSDYTGSDADKDGLGDTPYDISGGANKDYLPLVEFAQPKPTISIYTDKTSYTAGEKMHLGLDVKNPSDSAQKVSLDIYLDPPTGRNLTVIDTTVTLPAKLNYSNPHFKVFTLPSISSGTYTWHAILDDPVTGEIICEDTASWKFVSTSAPTADITEILEQSTTVIDFGE